ncbi:N-acetyltransferase 9-like protein isoform X2 [Paramacrobiotus metropolitanus]|uniref:N-acetyltransferase 9-like protein isoform X2 n=1 Tax=Paramacrobiotus metropolitanus TaxID=2943436 RepID=UPI002445B265|nr:N-acetyltransferase 9-like protein isoform X2 [Paramacrobiotus metropolitanus]
MEKAGPEPAVTSLRTSDLLFVPFGEHMIAKYSEWFADPYLRKMTSTESLNLAEATKAQALWASDPERIMFILLDRATFQTKENDVASMIGDVNLVTKRNFDAESFFPGEVANEEARAEVMLMIADPDYRGRKLGRQALLSIMRFAIDSMKVSSIEANISQDNAPSLKLFNSIGFVIEHTSDVFGEISLRFDINKESKTKIRDLTDQLDYHVETLVKHSKDLRVVEQ